MDLFGVSCRQTYSDLAMCGFCLLTTMVLSVTSSVEVLFSPWFVHLFVYPVCLLAGFLKSYGQISIIVCGTVDLGQQRMIRF